MTRRQALPRIWLVTDERMGDDLLAAVERLPRGSGILFRHYSLPPAERRALFRAVQAKAKRRHHRLLLAGPPALARAWRADGWHGQGTARGESRGRRPHSRPAHDLVEIRAAERAGASLMFLSPVFPTRSHPGGRTLEPRRFGALARSTHLPVIALGGVGPGDWRRLRGLGAYGWAGIDAWL